LCALLVILQDVECLLRLRGGRRWLWRGTVRILRICWMSHQQKCQDDQYES
jgi:hypothetical protein